MAFSWWSDSGPPLHAYNVLGQLHFGKRFYTGTNLNLPCLTDNFIILHKNANLHFYSNSAYFSEKAISVKAKKGDDIREKLCSVGVVYIEFRG